LKAKQGAAPFTVEMKSSTTGTTRSLGTASSFGRLKVKGVAVAKSYFKSEGGEILDHDGFFDTGDVATIDPYGMMQITDRSKDVINPVANGFHRSIWKISRSVTQGDGSRRHRRAPSEVGRASVAGHHPQEGENLTREEDARLHGGQDRQWWMPDDVVFVEEIPHTATGKILKTALREPLQGLHTADRGGGGRISRITEAIRNKNNRMDTFDYVIVGAGSAGCVLANRLSADPGVSVCVLEAGPRDWHPYIHIPAGFIKLFHQPGLKLALHHGADEWTAAPHPRAARQGLAAASCDHGHIYNRGQRLALMLGLHGVEPV